MPDRRARTGISRGQIFFRPPATFDGKQHLLSLPVVNSIDYVLRFLKKLCRSLHCENLFSDEPITQHNGGPYQSDGAVRPNVCPKEGSGTPFPAFSESNFCF